MYFAHYKPTIHHPAAIIKSPVKRAVDTGAPHITYSLSLSLSLFSVSGRDRSVRRVAHTQPARPPARRSSVAAGSPACPPLARRRQTAHCSLIAVAARPPDARPSPPASPALARRHPHASPSPPASPPLARPSLTRRRQHACPPAWRSPAHRSLAAASTPPACPALARRRQPARPLLARRWLSRDGKAWRDDLSGRARHQEKLAARGRRGRQAASHKEGAAHELEDGCLPSGAVEARF
jgi:hypothetical protein